MYDITIVGAGVSGIFLAYTLLLEESKMKILMIEKGKKFIDRVCPIESKESDRCIQCNICNRIQGFGGMGRSEGKFNYTNDFGGQLGEKIGNKAAMDLMEEVDNILCLFGGDKAPLYSTKNEELTRRAKEEKYSILTTRVRHLGTNLSGEILKKIYLYLKDKIEIKFETDIISITKVNGIFNLNTSQNIFYSQKVVLATGISGGEKFLQYCKDFNIKPCRERVDLGIRVEMNGDQLDTILGNSFETKISYKCDEFEAITYCMNPKGKIIKKYQEGLVMPDGQNHTETDSPSCNLNFTVFVPSYFSCYNEAKDYARSIIKSINKERGRIVVQKFEDLLENRITTWEQLTNNSIKMSLACEGANLYNEIPKIYIDALLTIFKSMEELTGRKISAGTLLYGIDAKFYEPEIDTDKCFESKQDGLYVLGDCSGVTYSLSQAAASGVYLGRCLLKMVVNN
ncbi:MAG TPA: FAD-dependent oxidoreductase [Clostridium sp.]|uniref:NAD(P)/FAD-dependent oxidoreductase n=1 Tax=Clostridium sp. TaxID=1506 RepID=UPI002F95A0DC